MNARGGPGRFRWPWRTQRQIESEIDEEIAFHLDARADALVRVGMEPAAARQRALREFGDVSELRRDLRRTDRGTERRRRRAAWWEDLAADVRFGLRSFRRTPGFTAAVVATLALGIGASVAIFSVVNAVLLRPLPYPDPDRLVQLSPDQSFNIAKVDEIGAAAPSLQDLTGIAFWSLTMIGVGEPVLLSAQRVDASFFDIFRVRPALGRPFRPEERDPMRSNVVILSDALWRGRFGGDPDVIGRRIRLDGTRETFVRCASAAECEDEFEIVGVMPRDFRAPVSDGQRPVDVWIPLARSSPRTIETDSTWYLNAAVGRLAPGATVERAAGEVRAVTARLREEYGNLIPEEDVETAGAAGLLDATVGDLRQTLGMLLGAVALVLLLACANLANLFLARGDRRREELAVRAALGATRGRIVRKLLAEALVPGLAGGTLGLALALGLLELVRARQAKVLPRMGELSVDLRVVLFALAVTLLATLLFGLVPALRSSARALRAEMGPAGRAVGGGRSRRRFGSALISAEVALATVLMTAAALLIATLRELRSVDPGLDAGDVLAVEIAPPAGEYDGARATEYYRELETRLAGLPRVRSVGAIHLLPFTAGNWNFPYLAEGHPPPTDGPLPTANFRVITPGYLDAVDVPILTGRGFTEADRSAGVMVGLINRTLAEELWPGESPVGRTIQLFGDQPVEVVGVVGDVHQHRLDAPPEPELYIPHGVWTLSTMAVMLEVDGDPMSVAAAARSVVREIDPDVPITSVQPLDRVIGESMRTQTFFASVLGFFGVLGLVLGAVGVYGVMAYAVGSRMREFGLRLALGATPGQVVRSAMRSGLLPALLGLVAGVTAAAGSGRLLSSLLYGIGARDPVLLAGTALLLGITAALASWLPAARAGRIDPARVLQAE